MPIKLLCHARSGRVLVMVALFLVAGCDKKQDAEQEIKPVPEISEPPANKDEPAWKAEARRKLTRKVSLEFDSTPVWEALQFLGTLMKDGTQNNL